MSKLDYVLLVDDDDVTNFVHESLLEGMDVAQQLLVAKNGQEAIDLIKKHCMGKNGCPSLIFLDINMPVMNGFEFLEAYHQLENDLNKSIIIVMLTSSLNPKDIERAQETGVDEFLNKPLTEENLKTLLSKHFDG